MTGGVVVVFARGKEEKVSAPSTLKAADELYGVRICYQKRM